MADDGRTLLSKVLRKRLETLGYASLRKFHADRENLGLSYELLRQVVYTGRIPRTETLLAILQSMRFSAAQTQKIMEYHGCAYPRGAGPAAAATAEDGARSGDNGPKQEPNDSRGAAAPPPGETPAAPLAIDDRDEIVASLLKLLPKIPLQGNEDFWDTLKALAGMAERKVHEQARREADQPLLFEKEPEAIYQFLVRRGKVPAYMSKGEGVPQSFSQGIDYKDRFRGALLGAAAGGMLGRPAQGLSPRDVQELYGRIDGYDPARRAAREGPRRPATAPAALLLARHLLTEGRLDPEKLALAYAGAAGRTPAAPGSEFARNLAERGFPWFEAGVAAPESGPAARVPPIALRGAADFRRMKLEAGIDASITHPNAASIAGAVAQAAAVARILHTPPGALDVLGFTRGLSPAISGIEPDRASRGRSGRIHATLWRKLGTELTALLLRRAEIEEVREALGNGPSVVEGLPFGWACFLRHPDDFGAAVLAAVNMGNDAEATAAIAGGLCGAYLGASAIPAGLLKDLPFREEITAGAEALLAQARRDA
ncbi:MAG: ADP-ribosylglycohydrolase family protein [Gemmatimonadota bacterium]